MHQRRKSTKPMYVIVCVCIYIYIYIYIHIYIFPVFDGKIPLVDSVTSTMKSRLCWFLTRIFPQGLPPGARPDVHPKTLENRVHELQKQVGNGLPGLAVGHRKSQGNLVQDGAPQLCLLVCKIL